MQEVSTINLYAKIAELIQTARNETIRAVNQTMVRSYFEIGRIIVEDEQQGATRAEYGKKVLRELSGKLSNEFGKGFSVDNLQNMRQFFLVYGKYEKPSRISKKNAIESQSHAFKLSWSHYLKLMRIADAQERAFYEIESSQNNWTLRELQRQFDSALYQRLALSRDKDGVKRLSETGQIVEKPLDVLKDPYVLEFLCLPERSGYSENDLESEIIGNLEQFLLELGKGFAFVGRQVRFTFDERHFRVDLVFFNRLLKCFVLIDLKIGELTHQDIGQMQMYVNYYDRFVKLADENKTVGILLCRDKSNAIVEITLPENNEQLFASSYKTVLPEKAELIKLLKQSEI
ncbi:MAG: DUF1016 domain-containing protein [Pyrinomonadaceae bacterium]|nr:DUF1016 domain-containing protein [Pyrinomonadaceae bacterium]